MPLHCRHSARFDASGRPIPTHLQGLCSAIGEFPGLAVLQAAVPAAPSKPWQVFIGCRDRPSPAGFASLDFLVWLQREARACGFPDLFVGVNASPPYLNGVGRSLYFFIEGTTGAPDDLALFIGRYRTRLFALPPALQPLTPSCDLI